MDKLKVKRTPAEAKAMLAKRRAAHASADRAIDTLTAAAALHRHEEAMRVLEQVILRAGTVRLDRVEDLIQPWPWIIDSEGRIVDHLLMAEPTALEEAVTEARFTVLPLVHALQASWREMDVQLYWVSAYATSLKALADRAEAELLGLSSAQGLRHALGEPYSSS